MPVEAALPGSPGALGMRRIRANAIAILTVAWILGTFYYLWQDNKPRSAAAGRSAGGGSGGARSGQRAAGRLELRREERTIPLIVSEGGRQHPVLPRRGGCSGGSGEPQEGCALPLGCFLFILAFVLVTMAAATIGEQGGHSGGN